MLRLYNNWHTAKTIFEPTHLAKTHATLVYTLYEYASMLYILLKIWFDEHNANEYKLPAKAILVVLVLQIIGHVLKLYK